MNDFFAMRLKILIFLLSFTILANANEEDEFGLGCEYDMKIDGNVPTKATLLTRDYEIMPEAYSLKTYCPMAKTQSGYGTCTSWATTYAASTICEAIANDWTDRDLITNEAFAPIFIYKQLRPEGKCKGGVSVAAALELLKTKGAPKFSSFNVLCYDYIPAELFVEAENYKIDGYSKLFDRKYNWITKEWEDYTPYETKINTVKKAISQGHPVVIDIDVYHSFDIAKKYWSGVRDSLRGAHALCVVGYDDNMYGGAFEIMNSWGKRWGNDGFIWIRYDDFFKSCKYAFDVYKKKKIHQELKKNFFEGEMYILEKDGGARMPVSLRDGRLMHYRASTDHLSGSKFRLYVSNYGPAWVYVIASDQTNNVTKLFPYADNISALLDYAQNNIAIPDESHEFQFDTVTGTDYFCVLYSQEELDIDQVVADIKDAPGSFSDKLSSALGSKMVPKEELTFSLYNMKVSAKSNSTVAPLIVEIKHK